MIKPAIEFFQLSKVYAFGFWGRKQTALSELTLSIPENSIYGFLGANGAGKTTAIKMLLGLQFPTSGKIEIFGQSPDHPAVKARIGFMPERPYLHDSLTADEFLNFHRNLFGSHLSGKKLPSNKDLLDLVGLKNIKDKYLRDFSKGMLQRVGIAQALVNDPDLVILDEPMSGLDPIGRKEVRDLIVKLSKQGKTIFFSSHILSDIESICHRVAFLEKGHLKKEGSVHEMLVGQSAGMEILFSGIAKDKVQQHSILADAHFSGDFFLLRCEGSDSAKKIVEEIWKIGGKVNSMQPNHKSLEEILFGAKNES